ncbi:MAG TPA: hypothetical protein VF026_32275 [Ktedonobacteraceae bacterium]
MLALPGGSDQTNVRQQATVLITLAWLLQYCEVVVSIYTDIVIWS